MGRPYALLRAGFPYANSLGSRFLTYRPRDIAIGREGRLYSPVTVFGVGELVRIFNRDDEDLGTIGERGSGDGQFQWPAAIVCDNEENVYVSDEWLHRVSIFDRDGKFLRMWGDHGDGDGQLDRPSGLAFDADENVYVSDTLNHRIQKFTKEGKLLSKWGVHGDGEGELDMPWGITVDELGDIYVADWRNDRVQKFTADGEFIFSLGTSGDGEGQFKRPTGVAVDSDGDIYVADSENNLVHQFAASGRYVDRFMGDATLGTAARELLLTNPTPLRLREMTPLEQSRRFKTPMAVEIDDQGRMYIVEYAGHRVQVYEKEAYPLEPSQMIEERTSPMLQTVG